MCKPERKGEPGETWIPNRRAVRGQTYAARLVTPVQSDRETLPPYGPSITSRNLSEFSSLQTLPAWCAKGRPRRERKPALRAGLKSPELAGRGTHSEEEVPARGGPSEPRTRGEHSHREGPPARPAPAMQIQQGLLKGSPRLPHANVLVVIKIRKCGDHQNLRRESIHKFGNPPNQFR